MEGDNDRPESSSSMKYRNFLRRRGSVSGSGPGPGSSSTSFSSRPASGSADRSKAGGRRTLEERLQNLGIDLDDLGLEGIKPPKPIISKGSRKGVSSIGDSVSVSVSGSGDSSDLSDRKSARLSEDLNRRITGISQSMEDYDKKVRDVTETLQESYRKAREDSMRIRKGNESGASSPDSLDVYLKKSKDNLAKDLLVELDPDYRSGSGGGGGSSPRTGKSVMGPGGDMRSEVEVLKGVDNLGNISPRKIFGLDAAAILESTSSEETSSSEDDDDDDEEGTTSVESDDSGAQAMRISIRPPQGKKEALKRMEKSLKENPKRTRTPRTNIRRKSRIPRELEEPRSLSPIMPTLPDKQFQSLLERREERVNRQLNSMKNELQQLNHRVEIDKRKALGTGSRGKMETSYQGRPMRLMKAKTEIQTSASEFNEFVQASGGKAGGWERKDHLSFMKTFEVWRKHPNKLMEALKKDLPHKKAQDIASHIKWYERFEELSSKNKSTVQKWSLEKRKENEIVYQMGSESHRAKLEGEKRRQEHLRMIREQERDKSKQRLAQWKRSQSVRAATASSSSTAQNKNFSHDPSPQEDPSSTYLQNQKKKRERQQQQQDNPNNNILGEYRDSQGNLDIPGVRQHILDITAKVHSLDHPKREFLPPRPLTKSKRDEDRDKEKDSFRTYSHTQIQMKGVEDKRGSVRLPELDSDMLSRPGSRPASRPSYTQNRMKLSEFRERDSRITEAKKKALEIARDRRRSNLNQLTAEELRRRIRSRVPTGPSQLMKPTKQSELRKSLTHLERLEMLSRQDLSMIGQNPNVTPTESIASGRGYMEGVGSPSLPPIINNVRSKAVPSWRTGVP